MSNIETLNVGQTDELENLGSKKTIYKDTYDPSVLETFENRNPERDYVVTFDCTEGSSLCPKTHQPDFFKLVISYIPDKKMVESKSLKLYIFSFRSTGAFHESIVNTVKNDLVKLMEPKYLEVRGIFSVRGGIAIYPFATYVNDSYPEYKDLERSRQLEVLRDASNRTVRYDM